MKEMRVGRLPLLYIMVHITCVSSIQSNKKYSNKESQRVRWKFAAGAGNLNNTSLQVEQYTCHALKCIGETIIYQEMRLLLI